MTADYNFIDDCLNNFDYIPIGICILDKSYKVLYWNLALEGWTGISKSDIIGYSLIDKFPHLNEPRFKVRIDLMFEGRPPMVFSSLLNQYFIPAINSEGSYHSQSATLTSMPCKSGGFNLVIAIENVSTLTNRVQKYRSIKNHALEEVQKRSEAEEKIKLYLKELEKLNATKDKFFSLIAHDLINPISTQYKIIESIQENFDSYSVADLRSVLEILHRTSKNTYKLLDNLLTWSRSQLNKLKCNIDFYPLIYIIDPAIKAVEISALEKKISIVNKTNEHSEIFADINMMTTIVRNLLSNAIKFTPAGGKITIEFNEDESSYFLSIADNGIGMPDDVKDSLFHIDKAVSTRGTSDEAGTGLGLILCKEFVDKHNGQIIVESTMDVGSTFTVLLPKQK